MIYRDSVTMIKVGISIPMVTNALRTAGLAKMCKERGIELKEMGVYSGAACLLQGSVDP